MVNNDADLDRARVKSSGRIRNGGDVVFDFIHSALCETFASRPREPVHTRHVPQKEADGTFEQA